MQPAADPAGAVGAGTDPVSGSPGATVPVRPLSFRELFDAPFALIQANIRALAVGVLACVLIGELFVVLLTSSLSVMTDGDDDATALAAIAATTLAAWSARVVLRATTVAFGLDAVAGTAHGWRGAFSILRARFGALATAQVVFTAVGLCVLAVSFPLLVTALPGLVFLGWLRAKRFVVVPVLLAEGGTHRAAVARTKLLVAGAEWSLVGLWFCQRMLFTVLWVPLIGIPWKLADLTGTHRWPVIVLITGAVLLAATFAEVIEASTRVLVYLDRRCRREGADIPVPEQAR